MKVAWAMLADAAVVRDGLAYVIAGGIDTVRSPSLPVPFSGTLVMRLAASPSEARKPHTVELVILGEDGAEHARVEAELAFDRADIPLGWDQAVAFAIRIEWLQLERFGLYRIDILLDGRLDTSINFRAIEAPPSGGAALKAD